ncbi:MAG: hypothetical protein IPH35_19700 [Rhodoferax sp.]|nr:hypothetical protein [Rhodoferax sp.]
MSRTFKKDPDAELDFMVDWADWLEPMADTIASVAWIPDTGLTVGATAMTTTTATAFISGGTAGDTLNVVCRVTTAGGRTDDRTITINIVNR